MQRRRSARSRTRTAFYSKIDSSSNNSSPQPNTNTSNPSLVSPESIVSSTNAKKTRTNDTHEPLVPDTHASTGTMPLLPDTAESASLSLSISPEVVLSAVAIAATLKSGKNKKRKSAASSSTSTTYSTTTVQRPTPEECEFAVLELGKLHPGVLEKCREIREQTTVTTNVASDCKIDKDIRTESSCRSSDSATTATTNNSEDNDGNPLKISASACGYQTSILDGVVSTLLSQNTTASNSTRAFGNLKRAVADWNFVAQDYEGYQQTIETAIHCGGLAQKKAANIVDMCRILHKENSNKDGSVSLEYLRHQTNEQIQADLLRFKGLGPKTVSCVLLFTLGRADFPVDTHVFRITKQHRWLGASNASSSRDNAYKYLNRIVPDHLKLELHCLLVQHGRECHRCAARGKPQFPPKDGTKLACPLVHLDKIVAMSTSKNKSIGIGIESNNSTTKSSSAKTKPGTAAKCKIKQEHQ